MIGKILLVDHQDSFSWNLVQLMEDAGASCVNICGSGDAEKWMDESYAGIVLSPGPGLPEEYPEDFRFISLWERRKPIFGICLGFQTIASYYGCSLFNLNQVRHGRRVNVHTEGQNLLFHSLPDHFQVGLYHSWAVHNNNFSKQLHIIARDEDDVIMGFTHKTYPIWGLQFHPESYMTTYGKSIMKNWLEFVSVFDLEAGPSQIPRHPASRP